MQSARLIVKNFGPLKDVDIEVRDFLCLIGKQATGKSTIAKLIAIFEDENFTKEFFSENLIDYGLHQFLKNETYISYKIDEDDKKSIFHFDFVLDKRKISFSNFKTVFTHLFDQTKIKDASDASKKLEIAVEIAGVLDKQISKLESLGVIKKILQKIVDDFLAETEEIIDMLDQIEENKKKTGKFERFGIELDDVKKRNIIIIERFYERVVEFIKLDSQYIPSERNFLHIIAENILGLINNSIQIPKHLLHIGQEYEKALNVVKDVSLILIDSKFKYKREGKASYIYHSSKEKVDLLKSASGIQSILPIILLMEYAKTLKENYYFNYVIEEPELNIYPATQHKLIQYLIKNIFDFQNDFQRKKLVITTHGPYILASINNLLLAYKKGQEKPKEVQKIIKKESWVNPENFNAYELRNGKSYKIMNDKLGQIKSNIIDKVTDEFSDEFDKLLIL